MLIGKDIPWKVIREEDLKVIHFVNFAEVQDDKVKDPTGLMPYGLCTVESPTLSQEALLPVQHKVDLRNLWEVFKVRGTKPNEEVIVFYAPPSGFLSAIKPKLHIYIFPKGHQDEMHDPNFKPNNSRAWLTPIANWNPK